MSEKEKKHRALYRKNREKWIFVEAVIIAVLTIAVLVTSIVSVQLKSKYYISYHEAGNIDYNVVLKDNDFFDKSMLGKDQSYVASLIDKIIADFSYEIDMDAEDVNYRYSYTIKSKLEITDNTTSAAIFNPEEELVSVQNHSQSSSNKLKINEIVVLNYDEYNDVAKSFLDTYELTSTTSNIILTLEVDVLSDCEAFAGSAIDTYTSELRIPLTTKTVNIEMTSSVPAEEAKMIACTRGAGSEAFKTTAIVLGVLDALAIGLLFAFIYFTRTPDITYTTRVKKILSQYKSFIQKINNLFETQGYQVIFVSSFDEMLEIRDTIQAPILMHENEDKTCTKFLIPTDSKLLYVYQIEVEGYTEPAIEKSENVPTTIVKPQITNVVRPVVKVVVNPAPTPTPDAEIETIVEEAELEVEAGEETPVVIATVEAEETEAEEAEAVEAEATEAEETEAEETEAEETLAEDEEIAEILAAIPEVEDESEFVDAIDVTFGDAESEQSYDPDGNVVEEGDVVLVPKRDEESDKEIVLEAEVTKGNYKVDPMEMNNPLRKIIGVVKRKAEQMFVAMITPEDEDNSEDNQ